jgi:hypothetical protein
MEKQGKDELQLIVNAGPLIYAVVFVTRNKPRSGACSLSMNTTLAKSMV